MAKRLGLVHVYTGNGKGKTTTAFGMALRAAGQNFKVKIIQFLKGGHYTGEFVALQNYMSHLVDIEDAGVHYNVYRFQTDFVKTFKEIQSRNKFPVLCGGSGLYLEAVLKNYKLIQVPPNRKLRDELEGKSLDELTEILKSLKPGLHNITDVETDPH